jgi:hypothetical protein
MILLNPTTVIGYLNITTICVYNYEDAIITSILKNLGVVKI